MPARVEPVDDHAVDPRLQEHFRLAEERGAPNSTLLRILARDPNSMATFFEAWNRVFYDGTEVDHGLKEIVRIRMARLRDCGY